MSSGDRQLVLNPLERALSTDVNRTQSFIGCALSEALRALLDTYAGTDDVDAGGAYIPNTAQGTPLTTEILSGLLFVPAVGSAASVVTPGVACVYDPDTVPSTDDSQYKLVEDPGSSTLVNASLALTPNPAGSGGTRIDIVECARVQPDNVVETDSRDVFDTVAGLFTAATLIKVTTAQFQYRIRTGLPGGGMPAFTQGWCPIAVASVPVSTTTWDACTLWDVRPLVSDRIFGTAPLNIDLPRRTKQLWSQYSNALFGTYQANGIIEVDYLQRRLGGQLRRGSPGTDQGQAYVDFSDPANQEFGISLANVTPGLVYVYLLKPFDLPRWARYTDAAAGARVPRSPRGIPLLTKAPPHHVYGTPIRAIVLPTAFGFDGASTTEAVCVGATTCLTGTVLPAVTSDGWCSPLAPVAAVSGTIAPPAGTGVAQLQENVHFPAGATRLRIALTAQMQISPTGTFASCVAGDRVTGISGNTSAGDVPGTLAALQSSGYLTCSSGAAVFSVTSGALKTALVSNSNTTGFGYYLPIPKDALRNGAWLSSLTLMLQPAAHGALPNFMPSVAVFAVNVASGAVFSLLSTVWSTDGSGTVAAYNALHGITLTTDQGNTIDTAHFDYYALIADEGDTANAHAGALYLGVTLNITNYTSPGVALVAPAACYFSEPGNTLYKAANIVLDTLPVDTGLAAGTLVPLSWTFETEVPNHYPDTTSGISWSLYYAFTGLPSGVVLNAATAQVVGWKME
jgi:hypothetical protein